MMTREQRLRLNEAFRAGKRAVVALPEGRYLACYAGLDGSLRLYPEGAPRATYENEKSYMPPRDVLADVLRQVEQGTPDHG